jgi:hypothetical protein
MRVGFAVRVSGYATTAFGQNAGAGYRLFLRRFMRARRDCSALRSGVPLGQSAEWSNSAFCLSGVRTSHDKLKESIGGSRTQ